MSTDPQMTKAIFSVKKETLAKFKKKCKAHGFTMSQMANVLFEKFGSNGAIPVLEIKHGDPAPDQTKTS